MDKQAAQKALDDLNAKLKAEGKTLQEAEHDAKTEALDKMKPLDLKDVWGG